MAENSRTIAECCSCKTQFLANTSSRGFINPGGQRICFNCFINSSLNNSSKDEEETPCPLLCSSILVGSPCIKENLAINKIKFSLEPCNKHRWTEVKSHKLHAYSYCTVCDVCLCSVCLLSTPHRYHETVQLSDLFSSIDDVPNQSSPLIKPSIEKGSLGKIAQRVITLLSTPQQELPESLVSTAKQKNSSLNNTSDGKSIFLLDVLNRDHKRNCKSKEPQINGFTVEETGHNAASKPQTKSITRMKSPLTANTSIYNGERTLQRSQRKLNMMSPLVKFKKKTGNTSPTIEYIRDLTQPEEMGMPNYTIYMPHQVQKGKGHMKTASLVPECLIKKKENKENKHPDDILVATDAQKAIKRVVSSTKTRCQTPKQVTDLSKFSIGIKKAFGGQTNKNISKFLVLSRMGISKDNFLQVIDLIRTYKIAELDLSHNSITDSCLPQLAELLKDQSIKVDLRGNLLTKNAVALFRKACPSCSVAF
jgi:hypothetical protein